MAAYVPPGWPSGVHPPGSEDFERTAQAWLLDTVPPDYRLHGVLRRYPLALAAMAAHHTKACVAGAREGYRTARTELGEALPPHALEAVLAAYRAEGRRLVATAQAVDLVARALRGEVFTPQLQDLPPPGGRRTPPGPAGPGATSGGRQPGPGTQDQLSAKRAVTRPDTGEQPETMRRPAGPAAPDQLSAKRAVTRPDTGEQPETMRRPAGPAAPDQLSAKRAAGKSAESKSAAGKSAESKSAENPAERPDREGTAQARKAPAAQRPARNGGSARRKTRPSDQHAAAG
jgi:hypothetical protein